MNLLILLMMATSATAADPPTVVQGPAMPVPSYSSTEPGWSEPAPESRPGLFTRIKNFFSRRSSPTPDQFSAGDSTASPGEWNGSSAWGGSTTTAPRPTPSPVTTSDPSPAASFRPMPATPSPGSVVPQRMPGGPSF
jgi:hypothetical protein